MQLYFTVISLIIQNNYVKLQLLKKIKKSPSIVFKTFVDDICL